MDMAEKELESINLGKLTQPEMSQFIDRQVSEVEAQGATVLTDTTLNQLLAGLKAAASDFYQGILNIQKSVYSNRLVVLNDRRNRAWTMYQQTLKTFKWTSEPGELTAYNRLSTMSAVYKGMERYNYEAKTRRMTSFLEDVESETFSPYVATLDLGKYTNRIKTANTNFDNDFGSRSSEESSKEGNDAIALRKIAQNKYNLWVDYIFVMARALDKEPFNSSLKIINTTRIYFDDINKHRQGVRKAAAAKAKAKAEADAKANAKTENGNDPIPLTGCEE